MSELHKALAQLQASLPKVEKTQEADAGKYKYTFAGLPDVHDALLPALSGLGLTWVCLPGDNEAGKFGMHYVLTHAESGEHLGGFYPLPPGGLAQARGQEVSYARRYLIMAVTGLAPDDVEPNTGTPSQVARAGERKTATRAPKKAQPPPVPVAEGEGERTKLLGQMFGLMKDIGVDTTQKEPSLAYVNEALAQHGAEPVTSRADLTPTQIGWVIEKAKRAAEAEVPPEEG